MNRRAAKSSDGAAPQSELASLLACERELDELWRQTEAEAQRRVSEARGAAVKARAALEAELEDACGRVRSRLRLDAERRVARIRAEAETRSAHLDAVTDAEVDLLAETAFRRLIAGEGGP